MLIRGCLEGKTSSWDSFVKIFGSVAQNIIRKFRILDPSDHENIVQNVFIKLLRGGLENFQGKTEFEFLKYFKMIVINEGNSYLKSQKRNKGQVSINGEVLEGISLKEHIADPNPYSRPDVVVETKEILDLITGILKTFPFIDRELFVLKCKDYKDEEVKEILGVPLGTVASKYSRIKTKIREELESKHFIRL